jgi:hypothetical protein
MGVEIAATQHIMMQCNINQAELLTKNQYASSKQRQLYKAGPR